MWAICRQFPGTETLYQAFGWGLWLNPFHVGAQRLIGPLMYVVRLSPPGLFWRTVTKVEQLLNGARRYKRKQVVARLTGRASPQSPSPTPVLSLYTGRGGQGHVIERCDLIHTCMRLT